MKIFWAMICWLVFLFLFTNRILGNGEDAIDSSTPPSKLSFPQSIHHIYHEFHPDLLTLVQSTLTPTQVYLEVQDDSVPYNTHLTSLLQYFDQGAVVFLSNNDCQNIYHKFNNSRFFCLHGVPSEISQDGFLNTLMVYFKNSIPSFIKFSTASGLLLQNSEILRMKSSLFYIRNEYQYNSPELIHMFVSAGYDVFWHISLSVSQKTLRDTMIDRTTVHPASDFILIHLIALPKVTSSILYSRYRQMFSHDVLFPYRDGLDKIEMYNRYIVSKLISNEHNDQFVSQEVMILSDLQTIDLYRQKGYQVELITQAEGFWNDSNEWITSIDHSNLPPPQNILYSLERKHLNYPAKNCEYISLQVELKDFQDDFRSSHDSSQQTSTSVYFLSSLPTSALLQGVIQACTSLTSSNPSNRLQESCQLYLTAMYWDISYHSSHCSQSLPTFQSTSLPFSMNYNVRLCTEPLWCNHTVELQSRLYHWQNPTNRTTNSYQSTERELNGCEKVKYLIYQPNYHHPKGIAGMLLELAFLFRFAICHGRILYLLPTAFMADSIPHLQSLHPFCEGSLLDCLFQPLSPCKLQDSEITNAPILKDGRQLNAYPFRDTRVVKIVKIPTTSHCSSCAMPWTGNVELFDGLHIGLLGYVLSLNDGFLETTLLDILNQDTKDMSSFSAFMDTQSIFWMAEMIRFILRPRNWFRSFLVEYHHNHLVKASSSSSSSPSSSAYYHHVDPNFKMTQPYANFHLSNSFLAISEDSLHLYFEILSTYAPHITDIFISMSSPLTDELEILIRLYPEYTFYFLHHDESLSNIYNSQSFDYFIYSMASLDLSSQAAVFVGNLHNEWDQLVNLFQRTRGDGGVDYYSIDPTASAYSVCVEEDDESL